MKTIQSRSPDFFLGATTPAGFKGYFEPLRREPGMQMLLIKSGPGCGKSTLMKHLAQAAEQQGQRIEKDPLCQRPGQSGRGHLPRPETRHHRCHRAPCGGAGRARG